MNKTFGTGWRRAGWIAATTLVAASLMSVPNAPVQAVPVPTWWTSTNFVKATEISVGDQPSDLVVSPDGDFVYVANRGSDTVSVIEASTGTVIATVNLDPGDDPVAIAITPDGAKVLVANIGGGPAGVGGSVSVIDTGTRTVVSKFDLGGLANDIPSDIAISPDGTKAYITLPTSNNVAYVNTSPTPVAIAGSITQPVGKVFNAPTSVAFSPDSTRAYVANSGATDANVLSVIDVSNGEVISNLATYTNNDNPELIAVSPIGGYGLMTVNQDGVLDRVDSFFVTADGTDGTNKGRSSAGWSRFTGLAFSDDGSRFYSVHNGSLLADDQLVSWSPVGMTPLGRGFDVTDPTGVATTPTTDSGYPIYVLHESTDKVTVFAQATPELLTTTGASGSTVTIDLDTPEIGFDLADNSVVEVLFNGVAAADLTASTGNTWTVTAPAGTGTVPVVVKFALGGRLSNNSAPAGDFTYAASGGSGPSIWTARFDTNGGSCWDASTREGTWTSVYLSSRYLPGPGDCTRTGFNFAGWANAATPTVPRSFPILTDPVTGTPRYFVTENLDLVAVWKPKPAVPTLFVALSRFFCGDACVGTWFIWDNPAEDPAVTITDDTGRTLCTTNTVKFTAWSICHEPTVKLDQRTFTMVTRDTFGSGPPLDAVS